jgi:hypothetical protein
MIGLYNPLSTAPGKPALRLSLRTLAALEGRGDGWSLDVVVPRHECFTQ